MDEKRLDRYVGTFMPFTDELSLEYDGDKEINEFLKVVFNFTTYYSDIKDPAKQYSLVEPDGYVLESLGANLIVYKILELITILKKPKNILEIGTFAGFSAISIAGKLCDHAILTTIEKFDKFADIAKKNIINNGFGKKINLINIDAMEYILNYNGDKFDMIFLDGNKENYMDYLKILHKHMNNGCVVIIDDAFMAGDTLNENPKSEKAKGVKKMLDYIKELNCFKVLLPISDGVFVLVFDE